MKINFNQEIKTIEGETIPKQGSEKEFLKLIDVAINALLTFDEKSTGEEKFKRYNIAKEIHSNLNEIDLRLEDIAMIKSLIGKIYSPLVVGQTWKMLEGEKE
jgi:hypothetical protein